MYQLGLRISLRVRGVEAVYILDKDHAASAEDFSNQVRSGVAPMGGKLAEERRMLPQRIRRDAVENRAPRCRQHGGKQLHYKRRLQIYKAVFSQQARNHVS